MERLLYISESAVEETEAKAIVEQIIADSIVRNADDNLTGALLFTGTHFAQVLEGSPRSVDRLMSVIVNDTRHRNIRIVDRSPISIRKFPDWKMAYFGPSQFVARHVVRLLNDSTSSERRRASQWLTELVHEFSMARAEAMAVPQEPSSMPGQATRFTCDSHN